MERVHSSKIAVLIVLLILAGSGCFPDAVGNPPGVSSAYFYYPIGLSLTEPDGRYLLVASSNFDLLYNSGLVVPLELAALDADIDACREGQASAGCAEFLLPSEADLREDDEGFAATDYLLEDHAVLIGSFASGIEVAGDLALVPVRADASLHVIDLDEVPPGELDRRRVLRCSRGEGSEAPGSVQTCGSSHRIRSGDRLLSDDPLAVPSEPYGVAVWTDSSSAHCREGAPLLDPRTGVCGCVAAAPSYCEPGDDGACDGACVCDDDLERCLCEEDLPPTCDPAGDDCGDGERCECDGAGEVCACAAEVRCGAEYVVVGHMTGGEVSLFERADVELPAECDDDGVDDDGDGLVDFEDPGCSGSTLRLVDVDDSLPEGTTGLAVDGAGRFLATSRFDADLTAFRINVRDELVQDPMHASQIAVTKTIDVDAAVPGDNQRGIALSPDERRAYVVSRAPESVLVLDVTRDEDGDYIDDFVAVIEIGASPSVIATYADERYPLGYLVYVVCFGEDRIYVIDPAIDEVVDIITTRRGPHAIEFDPARRVAYLANFLESTVSIIDVDPESETFHDILTTLGRPRRPRTND